MCWCVYVCVKQDERFLASVFNDFSLGSAN